MKGETSRLYIKSNITDLCTELGQLDSERKAEMEKKTIQQLYTHLEMQMKILRCKDAATLWECLQKVKPKSSIKDNIDNMAELLDKWRSLPAQSQPKTIEDAEHRFFFVFEIKRKLVMITRLSLGGMI